MDNWVNFEQVPVKGNSGAYQVFLDIDTTKKLLDTFGNRLLAKANDLHDFHCALNLKKDQTSFIHIGSTLLKKMDWKEGQAIRLAFSQDKSEYQFELPEELEEVLRSDPEAFEVFSQLTPGNQRGILYLVNRLKSVDKRIELSLRIAEKLKAGITKPQLLLKK